MLKRAGVFVFVGISPEAKEQLEISFRYRHGFVVIGNGRKNRVQRAVKIVSTL
jgi:hypothetical protein